MNRRQFLKNCVLSIGAFSLSGCANNKIPSTAQRPQNNRPNIILFISDDHGCHDSGTYGDSYIQTPHIDRLAAESMRFTHAFAASPLCSPSCCVIETGLMPHRNGGHKFGAPIKPNIKTMPEYFKEMGYYTAHIGKWHHKPNKQFLYDYINKSEKLACEFLYSYDKRKPLFLVVCTHPPHTPWTKNTTYDPSKIKLPPNFVDTPETRTDRVNYYSDVTLMDSILDNVLDSVTKKGMKDNTLFVYTTDQGSNWPFSKWCVYDGGLRVPFIVRCPGKIKPGTSKQRIVGMDIYPTMLSAAGLPLRPEQHVDGLDLMPLLTQNAKLKKRPILFHFPHYTHATGPFSAIIADNWKLILFYNDEHGACLLYNLTADPEEQNNMAAVNVKMRDKLITQLDSLLKEMKAEMSIKNPDFNPNTKVKRKHLPFTKELAEKERGIFESRFKK